MDRRDGVTRSLEERTTLHVLADQARERPTKVAVKDPDAALTFEELYDRVKRLGSALVGLGMSKGTPVLLLLDNHLDYVVAWLAVSSYGGIEVPVNTAFQGELLAHVVRDSQAPLVVLDEDYLAVMEQTDGWAQFEHVIVRGRGAHPERMPSSLSAATAQVHDWEGLGDDDPQPPPDLHGWDTAALMYTSGTTGKSKGVIVTHAHAYTYGSPEVLGGAAADDVTMVALPLFHVGGQWASLYNGLMAGSTTYVSPRFTASGFWDEVREHGCTFVLLVAATARFLYRQPPSPDDGDNPMRRVFMAPVIPEYAAFAERFDVSLLTGYGSTEAGTVLVSGSSPVRPDACGHPRPGLEVALVDDWDRRVPDGQVGEVVVRPLDPWVVMQGYHNNAEASVEAWRNLWFHTGDAMYRDDDGQYVFVDRMRDTIRRRGENVSSVELEGLLVELEGVADIAVVGVPSSDMEEEIKAVVVTSGGFAPDAFVAAAREALPGFMVPRYVEIVDELLRTESGKVQKQAYRSNEGREVFDAAGAGVPSSGART